MIKHIEELKDMLEREEYNIRRLTTLNVLIECRFINVDLTYLLRALHTGDEEDIENNRQILKRTIEKVIEGRYGCR